MIATNHSLRAAVDAGVIDEISAAAGLTPDDIKRLDESHRGDDALLVQFLGTTGDASCVMTVTELRTWESAGVPMIVEGKTMRPSDIKSINAVPAGRLKR
jgi:hypothetical protein